MAKKKLFDDIPRLENDWIALTRIESADVDALRKLVDSDKVYRYLPTYLFEKSCDDLAEMTQRLYDKCFAAKESLILGIHLKSPDDGSLGELCGLAEFYGYKDHLHKTSIGYRLLERYWGQGIATKTVALMVDYLYSQTDIEIITASTMIENAASARVLEKNDFICTARAVEEDWGFDQPTLADKWFC